MIPGFRILSQRSNTWLQTNNIRFLWKIPQPIEVANKERILAYGCGSVNVEVCLSKKCSIAILNDVWYVPDIGCQLFSVRQASEHGNVVI